MVSNFVLGRAPRAEQEKLDASIDFALGVLPDILAGEWNRAMKNLHSQKA
jgi:PTH1 family peptidyl-tRNA hydrolase